MIAPPPTRAPLAKITQQRLLERAIGVALMLPDDQVKQAQMAADLINADVYHKLLADKKNRYDPERYAVRLEQYSLHIWRGLALRLDLQRRGIIVESGAI